MTTAQNIRAEHAAEEAGENAFVLLWRWQAMLIGEFTRPRGVFSSLASAHLAHCIHRYASPGVATQTIHWNSVGFLPLLADDLSGVARDGRNVRAIQAGELLPVLSARPFLPSSR